MCSACRWKRSPGFSTMLCLLPAMLLLCHASVSSAVRGDVAVPPDVITNSVTGSVPPDVEMLQAEVKRLRRMFNRFRKGGSRKLCEAASNQMSDKITIELSGLRSQLHTSDTMKSLRSELEYGLASLRSEVDNKVTSLRTELEMGLANLRTVLQNAVVELKTDTNTELTDIRTEMQYNINSQCSGEKELVTTLSELQAGLQTAKSDCDNRVDMAKAEVEQKLIQVRSQLEGDVMEVQAGFKTDVVTVRSALQDMVADVRIELQDSMAGTRSELQTGFMAAQSGLQNSLQSLQANLNNVGLKARDDVVTLKAEMAGVTAVVKAEVSTQLAETKSQLQTSLDSLNTDLGEQLEYVASKLQELATQQNQLAYNTSELRGSLVQVKAEAENEVATLRSDLVNDLKVLRTRLDKAVAAVSKEVKRRATRTLTRANSSAVDVAARLTSFQDALDLRLGDLDLLYGDLRDDVDRLNASGAEAAQRAAALSSELVAVATDLTSTRQALQDELQQLVADGEESRGSTFVRWGRRDCTDESSLVYTGVVGGSSYDSDGGAANRLCLTLTPHPSNVTGARTYIYGAEYKFSQHSDMDVVCSLCHTAYPTSVMIPGTHTCPRGWRVQYTGQLTAGMVGHRAASEYLCLDSNPEHRPGSQEIRNGALFYYVFAECGSLPCPPYGNIYVSCVVCSR